MNIFFKILACIFVSFFAAGPLGYAAAVIDMIIHKKDRYYVGEKMLRYIPIAMIPVFFILWAHMQ